MLVDMDVELKDLDGATLKLNGKDLTLKRACCHALGMPLDADRALSGEEAVRRWALSVRIYAGGRVEISPEEASLLRERLPKTLLLAAAGQAVELLSGSPNG